MQLGEGGFRREKKRSYVPNVVNAGEHKPDSALIVWDDPVLNGVTYIWNKGSRFFKVLQVFNNSLDFVLEKENPHPVAPE